MKRLFTLLLAATAMVACSDDSVQITDNGVIVEASSDQKVRLEVIADNIVRVSAIGEDMSFSERESLITVEQAATPEFDVEHNSSTVTLTTGKLRSLPVVSVTVELLCSTSNSGVAACSTVMSDSRSENDISSPMALTRTILSAITSKRTFWSEDASTMTPLSVI